jgi:hypothetical protein
MERHHTQPDIQTIVIANLRSWYADLPPVTHTVDWPGLTAANELQKKLGWNHFYDGFLIADWMAIHQAYYDYLEKRHTGRHWASQLIRRLWTTSWDLWKHRMKILRTPDNASRIAHIALIDLRYDQYAHDPHPERIRHWFSQNLDHLHSEPLDAKEQWLQLVDAAFLYYH